MKKFSRNAFTTLLMAVFMLLLSHRANAVVIEVSPNNTSLLISDSLTVDVIASDLGNFASDSIGAFYIALEFDNSILQFDSISFGTGLDLGIVGSFQQHDDLGNSIKVDETSFEFTSHLNLFQPGSFKLFSITFTAIGTGNSALTSEVFSISDAPGTSILTPTNIINSTVNVGGTTVPASTPNVLALMGLGLICLKRKRIKSFVKAYAQA